MTARTSLRARWTTPEGVNLARDATRWLAGDVADPNIAEVEGRMDLRGFSFPSGELAEGGIRAATAHRVVQDAAWSGIDFSYARIPSLRLHGSLLEDCRFDGADIGDLRAWGTAVAGCSFVGANLSDSALGTWHDRKGNEWQDVSFDRANLRGSFFCGGGVTDATFADTKMDGLAFRQVRLERVRFSGTLDSAIFDGRQLPGDEPAPTAMTDVDFSACILRHVEFLGCHFNDVVWPPGTWLVSHAPSAYADAATRLESDDSETARMLRAIFTVHEKMPGEADSTGVIIPADLLVIGGEDMLDLASAVLGRIEPEDMPR